MIKKQLIFRILIYSLGLMFIAFGSALAINSNLGVSPINSLPYVISLITKLDVGTCITLVFSVYILIQILILRREFKLINLTQLFFSSMFGFFVDFAKHILSNVVFSNYIGQLFLLGLSVFFISVGVCVYMSVNLINMPTEALTQAIANKVLKIPFHRAKIYVDCTYIFTSIILSFAFLGNLQGIREGTIICAIFVGVFLKPLQNTIQPIVKKLVYSS